MNDISNIHISTIVRRASRFRPDRFTLLLTAFAVLGAVLVLLRVYNGVGKVGDSGYYLRAAGELIRGESWQVWLESSFHTDFPPGYPILLALASLFTFDPLDTAGPLNAAAFGLTIFISGHWLRQRVQARLLVVLGCLAVLVSIPVVWVASFVWSEMPFILLTTLALFQGDNYLRSGKRSSLIWAGVFTALAFLTRYAGVTILMALLPLFILQRRMTVEEKARDIGLYVAISTAPTGLWMLRNFLLTGTLAGTRTASDYSIFTNVQRTLDTIRGFNPLAMDYFPSIARTPEAALVILLLLAGLVGFSTMRWMYNATDTHEDSFLPVVGGFAFVYLGFMVVTATILQFGFNHLDVRFLSPAYVALTLAIVSSIDKIPKYWGELTQVSGLRNILALQKVGTGGVLARVLWPTFSAGILLLFVSYAGYTSTRDTLTALVNPAVGWNAYGWNADNVRIDASSVDDYLRDHVGDTEPIVRSTFDIYLKENTLIYVKEACSEEDAWKRVYLHVEPADRADLPGIRKQYGNENFDFSIMRQGTLLDGKCLGVSPLPDYDIASIHTGQYIGDTRSWQATFRMDE